VNWDATRRQFLLQTTTGLGAFWVSANWPAILAAAEHARHAAQTSPPPKFEFLTAEQAAEAEAIAAQIIPTDDTPGAREAGVVYFMDRALRTFASDRQKPFVEGLAQIQARTKELFPEVKSFSAASADQQVSVLKAIEKTPAFGLFRFATIAGFLGDPARGGNSGEIGWKLIGFDSSHVFQPPFGFYDKGYPGWQPNSQEPQKK
jgi:gluconate 2-dehydrogenase gamma chain